MLRDKMKVLEQKIQPTYEILTLDKFRFESGAEIRQVNVAYETYGTLNSTGTNAILICHALTGNSHASSYNDSSRLPGWWEGVIGRGKAFDPSKHFIVCSNFLGSCYGTTGPTTIDPTTGKIYAADFPQMTVRDMVKLQHELLKFLDVKKLLTVTGGSLGGMQTLEWALLYPELVETIIPIATSAKHSAWAIGLNEIQRKAIFDDPAWKNGYYDEQPPKGLATARMIAMMTYRSQISLEKKFGREIRNNGLNEPKPFYQIESYLHYQGEKLVDRFDANTYVYITRAMDLHDVSKNHGTANKALGKIKARTLCVGIDTDILYPAYEQKEICAAITGAEYFEIKSIHGHDAFLIEFDQLNKAISKFLNS